jgi:lipopolysaccharide export system permease protein
MSLVGALVVISILRAIGFFGAVMGASKPSALIIPYIAIAGVIVIGAWGIVRGVIIEPPAFVTRAVDALIEGVSRRAGKVMGNPA